MSRKEDKLYNEKFGNIPNNQEERIRFILGKKINNRAFNEIITKNIKAVEKIKRKKISFTMWKVVKPSARPRFNSRGPYIKTYVPHAKENGDWFESFSNENNLPRINTPCILNMVIYEKTPSTFNLKNKVLAELGILRPWKRTGDFDNYAKGIADCIQHGMLVDDCLVIESTQKLYYSIKPHAEIEIIYYDKHPDEVLDKLKDIKK